jgi:hypothetical protein
MAGFDNRVVVLALRIAQAILCIITLGLTAYGAFHERSHTGYSADRKCDIVADWWSNYWHAISPSQINFMIFASVWTVLALVYLIIVPWRFSDTVAHHKFAILGVESLTMLFWFASFIALAVFLSDRVCFGHVCSAAKAACVFGAFEWYVRV